MDPVGADFEEVLFDGTVDRGQGPLGTPVRDNNSGFSVAAYETIFRNTGIPERDIPRALNVLNACGLMARVTRENDVDANVYGPNKYYLSGYRGFFSGPESTATAPAEPAPRGTARPGFDPDIPF